MYLIRLSRFKLLNCPGKPDKRELFPQSTSDNGHCCATRDQGWVDKALITIAIIASERTKRAKDGSTKHWHGRQWS
jgi:hypothetical protein